MSNMLTTEQLENRMRPGQSSQGGFLGVNESLEAVIAQDEQVLARLGTTHEQIATILEKMIVRVHEQRNLLSSDEYLERQTTFPNLYQPQKNPHFSKENLPDINIGYLIEYFQIFFVQYRGFQDCPWDCSAGGSFDFMILNRKSGESFSAPALITHLIRDHHFFEGVESPYRVDPEKIIRTLEILQKKRAGLPFQGSQK